MGAFALSMVGTKIYESYLQLEDSLSFREPLYIIGKGKIKLVGISQVTKSTATTQSSFPFWSALF